jgi:murein DD-endopeptidase MepM/ murein hydrolase activator NlpD
MKKRKWFIRIVAIIMALLMLASVLYAVVGSLTAGAVTQSEIDKLKTEQKEIEKQKQELQSKINSLEYEQDTALAKKEVLDEQIRLTQDDITNTETQIQQYNELIELKEQEALEAQRYEDEQLERYKQRIREMEEYGTISYISVIFEANSFSDLLTRISDVGELMDYDKKLYDELKTSKQATIDAKASLEKTQDELVEEKANLEVKKIELDVQRAEAEALLKEYEKSIEEAKELYRQEQEASEQVQKDIIKKTEELKKQQQVKGTGTFSWPVPASNRVTSQYGRRWHPIFHENRMHSGIDIGGVGYGSKVLASDDGQVMTSGYSSSYGNYVVISHGNGFSTLYAHLSKRSVKEGDKVQKGQVLGLTGSTGNSTGPHLHFEIRKDGATVNPLNYFDKSTYVIDD